MNLDPVAVADTIEEMIKKYTDKLVNRSYKRGVISAASGQVASVYVEGNTTATTGILSLASYTPKVGDTVLLLSLGDTGANVVIIGKLDSTLNTITTDANGWTVYNFGSYKQYRKKGQYTNTWTAGQWTHLTASANLPVGVSTIGTRFVEGISACGDAAVRSDILATPTSTTIGLVTHNAYGGSVAGAIIYWSVCISE